MKINDKQWLIYSLLLHLLLISSVLLSWHHQHQRDAGKVDITIVHAYIVKQPSKHLTHSAKNQQSHQTTKATSQPVAHHQGLAKIKKIPKPLPSHQQAQSHKQKSGGQNDSQGHSELLSLLHKSIAQAQQYPQSAIAMGRSGTAIVEFMLAPNGHINHIQLVKSSHVTSLDKAAIQAVQQISPFKPAKHFISHQIHLVVHVSFSLS